MKPVTPFQQPWQGVWELSRGPSELGVRAKTWRICEGGNLPGEVFYQIRETLFAFRIFSYRAKNDNKAHQKRRGVAATPDESIDRWSSERQFSCESMWAEVYHCGNNNELAYPVNHSLWGRIYSTPSWPIPVGCGGYENLGTSPSSADQCLQDWRLVWFLLLQIPWNTGNTTQPRVSYGNIMWSR